MFRVPQSPAQPASAHAFLTRSLAKSLLAAAACTLAIGMAHAQQSQARPTPTAAPAPKVAAAPQVPTEHTNQFAAEGKSKQLCERVSDRVFVQHDLGSECIFYYATPGTPQHRPAVLYFEGDVPTTELAKPNFTQSYLNDMRGVFSRLATQSGVRFVFIARPGVFGSSGNHGSRRSIGEMLAMNAAVDAIKARLGLTDIVLAGQSGGSTVSAALLTLGRRDVTCAVLGSGLLSVVEIEHAHRVRERLPEVKPALLHVYLFDPTDRLTWIAHQQNRRVFVLGDPTDTRTPFPQQKSFAERVRGLGHHAVSIEVSGQGELMHGVAHHTLPAAAQCARGASDVAIQTQVAPANRTATRTQTSQLAR